MAIYQLDDEKKNVFYDEKGQRQWTCLEVKRKKCANGHWLVKQGPI